MVVLIGVALSAASCAMFTFFLSARKRTPIHSQCRDSENQGKTLRKKDAEKPRDEGSRELGGHCPGTGCKKHSYPVLNSQMCLALMEKKETSDKSLQNPRVNDLKK